MKVASRIRQRNFGYSSRTRSSGSRATCGAGCSSLLSRFMHTHQYVVQYTITRFQGQSAQRTSAQRNGTLSCYWVTVRRPVWVLTPPTETTTGCTPKGAAAGTVKLTCEMPTRPMGTPAKETVAAKPPTVTVTGSFGRGSLAVVVPEGGLAPVIRNVVVSPSPAVNRPGAAGATVNGKFATWPSLFTPKTARPLPVS